MGSEGPGTFAPRRATPLASATIASNVNSAFFQLKPTLKPECPGPSALFRFRLTQTHAQTRVSRVSRVFSGKTSQPGTPFPFNSNPRSNQSVQGLQSFFRENLPTWDSKPRQSFKTVPISQLDLLTCLVGQFRPQEKTVVGLSPRLRWFFRNKSGDSGHSGLSLGLS